jgi:hypothetical protein
MKFRMLGATAIAAILVAIAAPAPAAFAQNGGAQPVITKQIINSLNDARNAILAKDWATATVKLGDASRGAKTPADTNAINRLKVAMAVENKDAKLQLEAMKALLASPGALTPDETKQYKNAIAKVYLDLGDNAASLAAFRAYVDEYGGTPDNLIAIANDASKANDQSTAATYAEKAITAAKANGKPAESWYRLYLRSLNATGQTDKYYSVLETVVADYPSEAYWRELIARAQKEPKFGPPMRLDLYRALLAADVKMTGQERSSAAEEALRRGLPGEALALLEPAASELTSDLDKNNLASAKKQAASDKVGLAKESKDALAKGVASDLALIGEAQLSYGDNTKAVELLQAAVTKGIADPAEMAAAKLHLGIAQYRSGDKAAAIATWADVKTDDGAGALANNWTLIANSK